METESFRKSAPPPLAPKPFKIPAPFETKLANGLSVVVYEDRRLPLASIRVCFDFGEIDDPQGMKGLTAALASNLTQGTVTLSSKEIAEQIEMLGASLSANASHDHFIVAASTLKSFLPSVLNLLAEVVLHPSFPEKELNLYRDNTIKNLKLQRSQPDFLADEQVARVIYGEHPYSFFSASREETEALKREQLADFQKKMLLPSRAIVIAVGDIDPKEFVSELEKLFAEWKSGEISKTNIPAAPQRNSRTLTIVDRPDSAQSNIVLANPAVPRNHPDFFALLVMNQILGAGASSRLFMNLREEKGYTYGAYSSLDARRLAGTFEATAEVRTAVTGDSLREFFLELSRIRDEKVSEPEIRDAKNFLCGVFPIRTETQEGLANLVVAQRLFGLPKDYLQTYRENIERITADDVQRVARQFVLPDQSAMVIVGDAEEILKQVREFASSIEIFDNEKNRKNIEDYGKIPEPPSVDATAKWTLIVDAQGQKLPLTLNLKQSDEKLDGSFESPFGSGTVTSGRVSGNKISAVVTTDFQGQALELRFAASIENDKLTGTIASDTPGFPQLAFTGEKKS